MAPNSSLNELGASITRSQDPTIPVEIYRKVLAFLKKKLRGEQKKTVQRIILSELCQNLFTFYDWIFPPKFTISSIIRHYGVYGNVIQQKESGKIFSSWMGIREYCRV